MSKKHFVFIASSLFIVFLLMLSVLNLREYFKEPENRVLSANTEIPDEEVFWKSFLEQNPNYLPGYLELTKIQVENKDYSEAQKTIQKAEVIDPNSPLVKNLNLESGR